MNMKIAIIYFTKNGKNIANKMATFIEASANRPDQSEKLMKETWETCLFSKWRGDPSYREESLSAITKEQFALCQGLIFVGAVGIAVRSIAPFLEHKYKDPAVLVIDELGKFCIPILSGHVGGANELAEKITGLLGENMVAVITTATDLSEKWAVDVFAKKHQLVITDSKKARDISSKILAGNEVKIYVDKDLDGQYEEELEGERNLSFTSEISQADLYIGIKKSKENQKALRLVPKSLILGIGCKKNTDSVKIERAVRKGLEEAEFSMEALGLLCSIDLKAKEEGILEFCHKYQIPSQFYSSEELQKLPGSFSASAFVKSITGVDNVCERAALLGAGKKGKLLVKKQALDGVTLAVAIK